MAPPNRHLGGPLQFLQEPATVPLVVADAEFLFDNLGDTAASPDLAAEAISLRPVPEELGDQALLRVGEHGRAAWDGLRAQHLGAASADASEPMTDGDLGDAQGLGNSALTPALMLQLQGPQPPPLTPVSKGEARRFHTPILSPSSLNFFARRSVRQRKANAPDHTIPPG